MTSSYDVFGKEPDQKYVSATDEYIKRVQIGHGFQKPWRTRKNLLPIHWASPLWQHVLQHSNMESSVHYMLHTDSNMEPSVHYMLHIDSNMEPRIRCMLHKDSNMEPRIHYIYVTHRQ